MVLVILVAPSIMSTASSVDRNLLVSAEITCDTAVPRACPRDRTLPQHRIYEAKEKSHSDLPRNNHRRSFPQQSCSAAQHWIFFLNLWHRVVSKEQSQR